MMFSGHVASRSCQTCGITYSQVTPTSIMFFAGLMLAGLVFTFEPTTTLIASGWIAVPVWVIGNVGVVLGLVRLVTLAFYQMQPLPDTCPRCGEELAKGGGWYDFASLPTLQEVIAGVLYAGLILAVRLLAG
jgi:uncharacterized protein (DUF983 family)